MARSKVVLILGAGEMASGCAIGLHRSGYRIVLTEITRPLAVRRLVSFSEAVYNGRAAIMGIEAVQIEKESDCREIWNRGAIPLLSHPDGKRPDAISADALVDGRLLKGNHGLTLDCAPLVIGLGPGFTPSLDCHCAVETQRGPSLGALLVDRPTERNTGLPGMVGGYTAERVLRAPAAGPVWSERAIGDLVDPDEEVARVGDLPVRASIGGVLRGLIRPGTVVPAGEKIGDIDPRRDVNPRHLSDKASAVAEGVLKGLQQFEVTP